MYSVQVEINIAKEEESSDKRSKFTFRISDFWYHICHLDLACQLKYTSVITYDNIDREIISNFTLVSL